MRSLKIIILTDVFLPYKGGGQIWVWEVAKRLVTTHHAEVEIVTRKLWLNGECCLRDEPFFNGKLKVTRLGFCASWNNLFSRILFIFQSIFYLLRHDFDIIDAQAFISGVPAKIVSILKKKPVIFTVHGTSLETGKASLLEKIILTKIKYTAQISAASNFLKFKNVNKQIFVVSPGVDTDFYKPDFSKKENNQILFVGRLQKIKGTEILLQLSDASKKENIKLVVVGDGEGMNKMKKFIRDKNIKNVELKGELNKEQTLDEYQKASIFILPSQSEGFPLTILEAMACGLPIVASNVGDINKIVTSGMNGFTVDSQNTEMFAEKIKQIFENDKLRKEIIERNLIKIKEYSWDKTAEKLYIVYRKAYD